MGRIRTIKPDFPKSQSISRVGHESRLLFLLLLTEADDDGRMRGASRMLANTLYPYEDVAHQIDGWLAELVREGMVLRYEVDGDEFLALVNWHKHQKIDRKTASKFPPPPKPEPAQIEEPADLGRDRMEPQAPLLAPLTEQPALSPEPAPTSKRAQARAERGARLPDDFKPDRAYARGKGLSEFQVDTQIEKFCNYWKAQPGAKGVRLDWPATWQNWVIGTVERMGARPAPIRTNRDGSARHPDDL